MARSSLITLKYPARCKDCGAALAKGQRARYLGRDRIYGLTCHGRDDRRRSSNVPDVDIRTMDPGEAASILDPEGFYSADGESLGKARRCEDAPCCGCCP